MQVQDKIAGGIAVGNTSIAGGMFLGLPISDWASVVLMLCAVVSTVYVVLRYHRNRKE